MAQVYARVPSLFDYVEGLSDGGDVVGGGGAVGRGGEAEEWVSGGDCSSV